ncbi:hypothetical protein [Vibrio splendidus]|uniref:hypothetical protein n=1 Tax=Vibrio splendidus TaxID=29497 RepID=UPI0015E66480|nr:hypothetical protein [Vibrio splendidus]
MTDPAFNHLANGQSQQIAITYQVEDGHGGMPLIPHLTIWPMVSRNKSLSLIK